MKNYFTYFGFVLLIGLGLSQNFSCAKKSQWTTNSPKALEAFLQGREYKNSFNSDKALKMFLPSL